MSNFWSRLAANIPGILILLPWALTGCGPEPLVPVPVQGIVSFDDKPVSNGSVLFVPTDKERPLARGRLYENGSFELTTYEPSDGAVPGAYKVVVMAFESGPALDVSVEPPKPLVPKKYTSVRTTPIVEEVSTQGLNTIDIAL